MKGMFSLFSAVGIGLKKIVADSGSSFKSPTSAAGAFSQLSQMWREESRYSSLYKNSFKESGCDAYPKNLPGVS